MGAQVLVHQLAMIDDFLLDCSLSEAHEFQSEVSEYPVEKGADITDNVRPKALIVTMEALVSNTPINTDVINARNAPDESAGDAYAKLVKIRDAREPVTIRTSLDTFTNMALKSLSIPRASGRGDELLFSATWQQVQIITNSRSVTRTATPQAKAGKKVSAALPPLAKGNIAIVTDQFRWLDPNINTFRKGAIPGSAGKSTNSNFKFVIGDPNTLVGFWLLKPGPPDGVDIDVWNSSSVEQKRQIEQTVAKQNIDSQPFFDEETATSLSNRYQFLIVEPAWKCRVQRL